MINKMKLSINTTKIKIKDNLWIANIDWHKYDGGNIGVPNIFKYGETKQQAYDKLEELLIKKGHKVVK